MYHYHLILFIYIFIYVFIYWKSGTSDLMVLMLFVLQCTDYKWNFLTLTYSYISCHYTGWTFLVTNSRLMNVGWFVFVVWFDSGGDDATYHGVDSSPCRINPIRSIDGSPTPTFLPYYCPPLNFQPKVAKMPRLIHDNDPIKNRSPYLYSPYMLPAHRTTICRMKMVTFMA